MTDFDPQRLEDKLEAVHADVRTLKRYVVGESEPERSLMFRVSAHEAQIQKFEAERKRVFGLAWTAIGTAVTAAVMWTWSRITKGDTP